jgi:hypothetical protein
MFVDEYHSSVGLGSNMLVGMTADRRGLVPSNDAAKVARVGRYITSMTQAWRAESSIDWDSRVCELVPSVLQLY